MNTNVDWDVTNNVFDTSQDGFMMAFALEGYYSGAKTDERFFRWIAEITTAQDGEYVYTQFPM